jgi:hypothetical protein
MLPSLIILVLCMLCKLINIIIDWSNTNDCILSPLVSISCCADARHFKLLLHLKLVHKKTKKIKVGIYCNQVRLTVDTIK